MDKSSTSNINIQSSPVLSKVGEGSPKMTPKSKDWFTAQTAEGNSTLRTKIKQGFAEKDVDLLDRELKLSEKLVFPKPTEVQDLHDQINAPKSKFVIFMTWISETWGKFKAWVSNLFSGGTVEAQEIIKNLGEDIRTQFSEKELEVFVNKISGMYKEMETLSSIANILSNCSTLPKGTDISSYLEFAASYLGVQDNGEDNFVEQIVTAFEDRTQELQKFIGQNDINIGVNFLDTIQQVVNGDNSLDSSIAFKVIKKMGEYPVREDIAIPAKFEKIGKSTGLYEVRYRKNKETGKTEEYQEKIGDFQEIVIHGKNDKRLSGAEFYLNSLALLEKNLEATKNAIDSLTLDTFSIIPKEPSTSSQKSKAALEQYGAHELNIKKQANELRLDYANTLLKASFEATMQINDESNFSNLNGSSESKMKILGENAKAAFNAEVRVRALNMKEKEPISLIQLDAPKLRSGDHRSAEDQIKAHDKTLEDLSNKMRRFADKNKLLMDEATFANVVQSRCRMLSNIEARAPKEYKELLYSVVEQHINSSIEFSKSGVNLIESIAKLEQKIMVVGDTIEGVFSKIASLKTTTKSGGGE